MLRDLLAERAKWALEKRRSIFSLATAPMCPQPKYATFQQQLLGWVVKQEWQMKTME